MLDIGSAAPDPQIHIFKAECEIVAKQALEQFLLNREAPDFLPNLYGGELGQLVALCSISRTLGGDAYKRELSQVGDPSVYASIDDGDYLSDIGLARGIGALVYAQAVLSQATSEARHVDFAAAIARKALDNVEQSVADVENLSDVMHGFAGLLIASCRTLEVSPQKALRECVRGAAIRLADVVGGLSPGFLARLGASAPHGLSGLGFALFLSGQTAQVEEAIVAGERCFSIEESLYCEEILDWPDGRFAALRASGAWCHGSAGVGMIRLSLKRQYDNAIGKTFDNVISLAVGSVLRLDLSPLQTACCGNCGRLEALAYASSVLRNSDLSRLVKRLARCLLHQQFCSRRANASIVRDKSPGLFQGFHGMVDILCRIAYEKPFPSFLAFEV
ncbi:lanthionine synthetase LanC family protein [Paraburkholderia fungorum]|uniref:lanthionine synthetase LanC family protein n=1 Tax=Paraburkholderia fungorum TaxID=134537 RepID=UPI001C1EC647|nr:lanthionine synthetase LanC family protein [Paraburkholderia fungorum]MBU7440916.1 hypothetical protein [Paraburkholderia fungorum]